MISRRPILWAALGCFVFLSLFGAHYGVYQQAGSAAAAAILEKELVEPAAALPVQGLDESVPNQGDEIHPYPLQQSLEDQFPTSSLGISVAKHNILTPAKSKADIRPSLFIAFGRNWFVLHQCVVSYIAAGWPASDITIFDNSGTMLSNELSQLAVENPAYVNVTKLAELGVNYERVPTLLTFSQLQNFFLSTAIGRGLDYYYWSHMDVTVLSEEEATPYRSFYERIMEDVYETTQNLDDWAQHFYRFDWLTLVNTKAYDMLGGWDVAIPYYTSDCDFYSRLQMYGAEHQNGWRLMDREVGKIFDTATPMADLSVFFPAFEGEPLNTERYKRLKRTLTLDMESKGGGGERNSWQNRQSGGHGDPYFKSSGIRDESFGRLNQMGLEVFEMKWHTDGGCSVYEAGRHLQDMYKDPSEYVQH